MTELTYENYDPSMGLLTSVLQGLTSASTAWRCQGNCFMTSIISGDNAETKRHLPVIAVTFLKLVVLEPVKSGVGAWNTK